MFSEKLRRPHVWRRIFFERLTEPLHLNVISLFVAAFGSYRAKITFDLIPRQHYAYGVLRAADLARSLGLKAVCIVEFGVAEGTGLMNLCTIGRRVSAVTGVDFTIVGFDTGVGMPQPRDYRDHPDLYQEGDFPMIDRERLMKTLPSNARIIFGQLKNTVPEFAEVLSPQCPLGFAIIDIDYYSSARDALGLLTHPDPTKYLPLPCVYVDNILDQSHNVWCGELLALQEFNTSHPLRKLARDTFLRSRRVFKHAIWLDQIFLLHMLDHPHMQPQTAVRRTREQCGNPFFGKREVLPKREGEESAKQRRSRSVLPD
jgi:hypothetical protein